MSEGRTFALALFHINWYTLKQEFDNFVNKLSLHYLNGTSAVTDNTDNNKQALDKPLPKKVEKKFPA